MPVSAKAENLEKMGMLSGLISALSEFFSAIVRECMPDPFIFAVILTFVTGILGIILGGKTPAQMVIYWGDGFWNLLSFAMQMTIVLVTGYVLAKAPLIQRILNWLAGLVHTPARAVALATLVGGVASFINWGFGLIVGSLIARKLAERVSGVHYPLIIAAAYSGFTLYGLGLSSAIPLLIATKGHFLEKQMGVVALDQTLFTPVIWVLALVLLVTLPILNGMIRPRGEIFEIKPDPPPAAGKADRKATTIAEKLENSRLLAVATVLLGAVFIFYYFFVKNNSLDINSVNFIFMFLGLLLYSSPRQYINAISEAARSVGGMILQYPFYAGIMGMMAGSGLVKIIASWFIAISSPQTLPFYGWLSSMVINFFTPSAGGHWVIQGPFMIEAAKAMGADIGKAAMSVQLGNSWQDIIQPMWLLPALAISGLGIRDIMGYNVIAFLWTGLVLAAGILLWGFM
jgi:short-chain fatty acids transporter